MSVIRDPDIFRTVLDSLQTGVCLVDRDRRVLFWNNGAERITGYMRHDVVGRFSRENILVHCNDQGCVLCGTTCPFAQTMHDGKAKEIRIQLRHKQGQRIPVRMRIVPIRDDHGSIACIAQSFDEHGFAFDDRRQHNLAAYGCLDETTDVPNHAFTQFHLRENHASFAEYHVPFGIIFIQVNQLEHFRSTYGKEAGDAILRVVAETMRNVLRPSDFLGRWSKDRFLAILINCTRAGVTDAGDRIRKVVSYAGLQWWGDELSVTVSTGCAPAQSGDTIDSLLERAQWLLQESCARHAVAASAGSTPRSTS
jgi:diguanylate cyclase (GGDEF)-like protein/PAS domain S-box-containing protein